MIIGADTILHPDTVLSGYTVIGEDCVIGPQTRLENAVIGNATEVRSSVATDCQIGNHCVIGPFSHIRPESLLEDYVTIGAYVEIKNSTIGDYTRARHLTYVGDSQVGKNVNFGCGTVTCNYDGLDKSACIIEDNVFIGGNSNLISPLTLKENAYVAAGSTITEDVPELSLAIARSRQVVKEGWVIRKNRVRNDHIAQNERDTDSRK